MLFASSFQMLLNLKTSCYFLLKTFKGIIHKQKNTARNGVKWKDIE